MRQITRREFCKFSALAGLSVLPGSQLLRPSSCFAAAPTSGNNYYLARRQELLHDFACTLEGVNEFLAPEFGLIRTRMITDQAMKNFEARLPKLPDVGGDQNWDTEFIPIAAWYVSLYEPMRQNGKTAEEVGKLIYDLNEYCRSQGTPEIAPYICPTDFDRSRTYGTGLQRTKTIARGDGICNFRFKKDRPVVQNWSTELALIRASRA